MCEVIELENNTCCFFGHRTINETEELEKGVRQAIERLIKEEGVDTFLFGSKSQFNDLCRLLVTELKEQYPHIKRIYVRAEYPDINDDYKAYLRNFYEDSYYPERIRGAGRLVYVERNCEMIDKSRFCVVYCDGEYTPSTRKSGTKLALEYAVKQKKEILLFPS